MRGVAGARDQLRSGRAGAAADHLLVDRAARPWSPPARAPSRCRAAQQFGAARRRPNRPAARRARSRDDRGVASRPRCRGSPCTSSISPISAPTRPKPAMITRGAASSGGGSAPRAVERARAARLVPAPERPSSGIAAMRQRHRDQRDAASGAGDERRPRAPRRSARKPNSPPGPSSSATSRAAAPGQPEARGRARTATSALSADERRGERRRPRPGCATTSGGSSSAPTEMRNSPSSRPLNGSIVTSISRRNSVSASSRPAINAPSAIDRPARGGGQRRRPAPPAGRPP